MMNDENAYRHRNIQRFGIGEIEKSNGGKDGLPVSAWDLRHKFLSVLTVQRNDIFCDLAGIPKPDQMDIPPLDYRQGKELTFRLFAIALDKWRPDREMRSDLVDTPFHHYVGYLKRRTQRIAQAEKIVRNELSDGKVGPERSENILNYAIRRIVPSWTVISERSGANELVRSITDWATIWHLPEDWACNFALMVLRNLYARMSVLMSKISEYPDIDRAIAGLRWYADAHFNEALNDSLGEFVDEYVLSALRQRYDDLPQFPPFEFVAGQFRLSTRIWFPHLDCRGDFISNVLEEFDEAYEILSEFNLSVLIEEACRERLREYCDAVKAGQNKPEPHTECVGILTLLSMRWDPSSMAPAEFEDNFLANLQNAITHYKTLAAVLTPKTRGILQTRIEKYCDRIERSMPPTYKKTPQKYTDEDFVWLIDYRVQPWNSYSEIAKRHGLIKEESHEMNEAEQAQVAAANEQSADTVKKAVTRLRQLMYLSPRPPKRAGPKPGIIGKKRGLLRN